MNPKLQFLLALQEEGGGAVRFDRWMHEALYHPKYGYYASQIRGIGRSGDFTTWPQLQDNLGRAIARWAVRMKPARGPWNVIEIGAGTGELSAAVLGSLGWWNRPAYHIVDVSEPLRALQKKRLRNNAQWHATLGEALAACGGRAVIFSNELADAFPCRIFQSHAGAWRELFLRIDGGQVIEEWRSGETLPDSTAFEHPWPDGQRVEVLESFHDWRKSWDVQWREGAMLTIDYGDTVPPLYHRRPRGTLRAYAHHQRLEGREAYAGFGQRDLTVDVNFSDLQRWAGVPTELLSLHEFLRRGKQPAISGTADAAAAFQVLIESRNPA